MKISKSDTKLPERVEDTTCQLGLHTADDPITLHWLILVSNEDLMKVRNGSDHDYVAFPNVFTIFHGYKVDVLAIWPKPDQPYEGIFEYCPARKQI